MGRPAMIYLSGVIEVELKGGKHVLAVAAWLQRAADGRDTPMFLGFDPKTHEPHEFSLRTIAKINSVLVR